MSWLKEIQAWTLSLEERWKDFGSSKFSDFAFKELSSFKPSSPFNLKVLLDELFVLKKFPYQVNPGSSFGQPPITLFSTHDQFFYLDLYLWQGIHTGIHQHGFEGAFCVLDGCSVESKYSFRPGKREGESYWGKLEPLSLQVLRPGDVQEIKLRELIHRVLHLSSPSVSLILRTGRARDHLEFQFEYEFSCLASPGFPPGDVVTKLRSLEWYLQQGYLPSFKMIETLLSYPKTWDLLFIHPHCHNLLHKLTKFNYSEYGILTGLERRRFFNIFLNILKDLELKILLIAYEQFGLEGWEDFLSSELQLTSDRAVDKLISGLKECDIFTEKMEKSNFFRPLFENIKSERNNF